jgi:NAD(P)-dependent dehydrogenase (short-subunit alcohol dehydrogenase family)
MIRRFIGLIKKLFSAEAPAKIAHRVKVFLIAQSVVSVNPLFKRFSYQLRIHRIRLDRRNTAIVIGAGGGIGEAVVRRLLEQGCTVIGTYRNNLPELPAVDQLRLFRMDITSTQDICRVYSELKASGVRADLLLVATGVNTGLDYHATLDGESLSSQDLELEGLDIAESFRANTLGPYLVVRRFAGLLSLASSKRKPIPQICLLSSSLGTMNNELYGGMYGYRTGKGALHAVAMAMYCDLNLSGKVGLQVLGPGNVATRMNVGGQISADVAAREIVKNVEYSASTARFQFLGVGGKRIAW